MTFRERPLGRQRKSRGKGFKHFVKNKGVLHSIKCFQEGGGRQRGEVVGGRGNNKKRTIFKTFVFKGCIIIN